MRGLTWYGARPCATAMGKSMSNASSEEMNFVAHAEHLVKLVDAPPLVFARMVESRVMNQVTVPCSEVLKCASACSVPFSIVMLLDLVPPEFAHDVDEALQHLVRVGFLTRVKRHSEDVCSLRVGVPTSSRGAEETHYEFTHTLEREIVYSTTTEKRRRRLHEKFATSCNEHPGSSPNDRLVSSPDSMMSSEPSSSSVVSTRMDSIFSSIDAPVKLSAARRAMHWEKAGEFRLAWNAYMGAAEIALSLGANGDANGRTRAASRLMSDRWSSRGWR